MRELWADHALDSGSIAGEGNCRPAADASQKTMRRLARLIPALPILRRKDGIETTAPALDILDVDGKHQACGASGASSLQ